MKSKDRNARAARRHSRGIIATSALLALALLTGCGANLPAAENTSPSPDANPEATPETSLASGSAPKAISLAAYPEAVPYPDWDVPDAQEQYELWESSLSALRPEEGFADGLENYWQASLSALLEGEAGKNRACSPVNVYMALAMLAECAAGESRQQILSLLGAEDIESLRAQASALWRACYRNDGTVTDVLASSLWLRDDLPYVESALQALAEHYYASAYSGSMGSEEYNELFRKWLNDNTGNLLSDQISDLSFDASTLLALATTVYFQASWEDAFPAENTAPDTFHALSGDLTHDFMHQGYFGEYYEGDGFRAVTKQLGNGGGKMWFFLPDEGVSVDALPENAQLSSLLYAPDAQNQGKSARIDLSLPKFDISAQTDLTAPLQSLGITDVFSPERADFSPVFGEMEDELLPYLSDALHGVRVVVDEEGVTAAAYTVLMLRATAALPNKTIEFTLDRPFLFAITSEDNIPLFAGIVHQP